MGTFVQKVLDEGYRIVHIRAMPRSARLDAPGVLHHVMGRGIEKRKIFFDDRDRDDFLERLGKKLQETQTACYAWALIPNHALC